MVLSVDVSELSSSAAEVGRIGSAISQAHAAAAPMTTSVVAAAGDEVSASVAALFSEHGAAFHSHFVQALTSSGAGTRWPRRRVRRRWRR
jgi:hypothetical protein